jgi:hypothetical protein
MTLEPLTLWARALRVLLRLSSRHRLLPVAHERRAAGPRQRERTDTAVAQYRGPRIYAGRTELSDVTSASRRRCRQPCEPARLHAATCPGLSKSSGPKVAALEMPTETPCAGARRCFADGVAPAISSALPDGARTRVDRSPALCPLFGWRVRWCKAKANRIEALGPMAKILQTRAGALSGCAYRRGSA